MEAWNEGEALIDDEGVSDSVDDEDVLEERDDDPDDEEEGLLLRVDELDVV